MYCCGIKPERLTCCQFQVRKKIRCECKHAGRASTQNRQMREVARARSLPVGAGFLQFSLTGGKVFVLGRFHGGMTSFVMPLS